MNQCRQASQPLLDSFREELGLFFHLGGDRQQNYRHNQLSIHNLVFEVPASPQTPEMQCTESLIAQTPASSHIEASYHETLEALRQADTNHDHFVSPLEVLAFSQSQAPGTRFNSAYAFRRAADYYTNVLPNYLSTPSPNEQATPVDALRTRLTDYATSWSTYAREHPQELQSAGIHPWQWDQEVSLYGLSLDPEKIQDLLNRFQHDQEFPQETAQVQPDEIAAINLLFRETQLRGDTLHLGRAPFEPQEFVLLSQILHERLRGNEQFLGQQIVETNPENSTNKITISQMLQLALPNSPAPGQLNALRIWINSRNTTLDLGIQKTRSQGHNFISPGNLFFMGAAYAYHHLLQPLIFQFHFNKSILISEEASFAFQSYRAYLNPSRPEYLRRFLNHGTVHYVLLPLILSPIIGGAIHLVTTHLIPESERHNPSLNLALESGLNSFIGIPLIEWICRSGRLSMGEFLATARITAQPTTLSALLRNRAFVLGWVGIMGVTALSLAYLHYSDAE
ncbi:MAG: hypothetical protein HQM15_02055 [Deltaproteobacteria bacterium]|nr:hypothetical protein [Deltaproteobacteria bacterium]